MNKKIIEFKNRVIDQVKDHKAAAITISIATVTIMGIAAYMYKSGKVVGAVAYDDDYICDFVSSNGEAMLIINERSIDLLIQEPEKFVFDINGTTRVMDYPVS